MRLTAASWNGSMSMAQTELSLMMHALATGAV